MFHLLLPCLDYANLPAQPIHIHLIDFQVVSRTGGTRGVLPYEQTALKDVVWLNKNEKVQVLARYGP
jgi:bilirubin oxidase